MRRFFEQYLEWAMWTGFVLLGGAAGYFYYQQIGCETGNCPISSDPLNSVMYGVLLGAVAGLPRLEVWFRKRRKL
jgi:hypothetical protein